MVHGRLQSLQHDGGIFTPEDCSSAVKCVRLNSLIIPYSECRTPPAGGDPSYYYFDDPQLGCSDRLVAQDVSDEHAWQLSQEFRLASNFKGPFNFSVGGNYMHYETVEDYYVFSNTLDAIRRGFRTSSRYRGHRA